MWCEVSLSTDLANVIDFQCIFVRVLHDLLRKSLLHESAMVSYFKANLVNTGVNNFLVQFIFKSFRSFILSVVSYRALSSYWGTKSYFFLQKPLKTCVNSKYQSKGSTYIIHLLAFVEIRLFNVFVWERRAEFRKLMKNVRDAGFSRKRGGNAGSGPPLPDPVFNEHFTGLAERLADKTVGHLIQQ